MEYGQILGYVVIAPLGVAVFLGGCIGVKFLWAALWDNI